MLNVKNIDHDALKHSVFDACLLHGQFQLRSGRTATEYFDKYQFESRPDLLSQVAIKLAPKIPPSTQVLAGLELGGVPLATAISLHTDIPAAFVRKQAKAYGTCNLAEGAAIADMQTLVVEDVVTTGGQIIESVGLMRERGAIIDTAVCAVLRDQEAVVRLAKHDIALEYLFLMN